MGNHNAKTVGSNPAWVTIKTLSARRARESHPFKSILLEKSRVVSLVYVEHEVEMEYDTQGLIRNEHVIGYSTMQSKIIMQKDSKTIFI